MKPRPGRGLPQFCSRACANKRVVPPAQRQRHRDVAIANLTSQEFKRSSIELAVEDQLNMLGIHYIAQFPIRDTLGRYVCVLDFMLPNGVGIEVNGTFWHCDPRFYPNGPHGPKQKDAVEQQGKKWKLLKELGIPVVEIWEHDIRQDPATATLVGLREADSLGSSYQGHNLLELARLLALRIANTPQLGPGDSRSCVPDTTNQV